MGDDGKAAAASDDLDFLMSVADLSNDVVEGVRIGVARFAIIIYGVLENCCKCVMKIESVGRTTRQSFASYPAHLDETRPAILRGSIAGGAIICPGPNAECSDT